MDEEGLPSGVLIAGGENGDVILYDPAKIIAGDSDVVIAQSNKHIGPVRALEVNSFQVHLTNWNYAFTNLWSELWLYAVHSTHILFPISLREHSNFSLLFWSTDLC